MRDKSTRLPNYKHDISHRRRDFTNFRYKREVVARSYYPALTNLTTTLLWANTELQSVPGLYGLVCYEILTSCEVCYRVGAWSQISRGLSRSLSGLVRSEVCCCTERGRISKEGSKDGRLKSRYKNTEKETLKQEQQHKGTIITIIVLSNVG